MKMVYDAVGYYPYQYDEKREIIGTFDSKSEAEKAVVHYHAKKAKVSMGGSISKGQVEERLVFDTMEEYINYEDDSLVDDIMSKFKPEELAVLKRKGIIK